MVNEMSDFMSTGQMGSFIFPVHVLQENCFLVLARKKKSMFCTYVFCAHCW